jgi:hypothetical protein
LKRMNEKRILLIVVIVVVVGIAFPRPLAAPL